MSWMLMPAAQRARGMTQSAKLVLFKLIDHADDDGGHIYPSIASLAEMAMCNRRTVQRILRDLCVVGLLSVVEQGGGGPGRTTRYRLHVDVLEALAAAGEWARRMALAPAPEGVDCDIIPDVDEAEEKGGIMPPMTPVSPLGGLRAALATAKGDMGTAQTLIEPLEIEREGARARAAAADAPADQAGSAGQGFSSHDGERPGAGAAGHGAGLGEGGHVTLAALMRLWPSAAYDDGTEAATAWEGLDFQSRRAALAGVEPYLAGAKKLGRTKVCSVGTYLVDRRWERLPAPGPGGPTVPTPAGVWQAEAWTRNWWALLIRRARAGQGAFMLTQAEAGKPACCPLAEKPTAEDIEALKPFPAGGPEVTAWRAWFAARRVVLPKFRGDMWVWLPGAAPEGV